MRLKKPIIIFFIIYIFAWNLSSCSILNASEPDLNCETFVNEKICNMTDDEMEKWFWELFKSLIEQDKEVIETIET
jgi:hypothetical protein